MPRFDQAHLESLLEAPQPVKRAWAISHLLAETDTDRLRPLLPRLLQASNGMSLQREVINAIGALDARELADDLMQLLEADQPGLEPTPAVLLLTRWRHEPFTNLIRFRCESANTGHLNPTQQAVLASALTVMQTPDTSQLLERAAAALPENEIDSIRKVRQSLSGFHDSQDPHQRMQHYISQMSHRGPQALLEMLSRVGLIIVDPIRMAVELDQDSFWQHVRLATGYDLPAGRSPELAHDLYTALHQQQRPQATQRLVVEFGPSIISLDQQQQQAETIEELGQQILRTIRDRTQENPQEAPYWTETAFSAALPLCPQAIAACDLDECTPEQLLALLRQPGTIPDQTFEQQLVERCKPLVADNYSDLLQLYLEHPAAYGSQRWLRVLPEGLTESETEQLLAVFCTGGGGPWQSILGGILLERCPSLMTCLRRRWDDEQLRLRLPIWAEMALSLLLASGQDEALQLLQEHFNDFYTYAPRQLLEGVTELGDPRFLPQLQQLYRPDEGYLARTTVLLAELTDTELGNRLSRLQEDVQRLADFEQAYNSRNFDAIARHPFYLPLLCLECEHTAHYRPSQVSMPNPTRQRLYNQEYPFGDELILSEPVRCKYCGAQDRWIATSEAVQSLLQLLQLQMELIQVGHSEYAEMLPLRILPKTLWGINIGEKPVRQAIAEQQHTITSGDTLAATHYGAALTGLREYAAAEKWFRRAISWKPRNIDAYLGLGSLLVHLPDRADDALALLEEALPMVPKGSFPLTGDVTQGTYEFASLLALAAERANANPSPAAQQFIVRWNRENAPTSKKGKKKHRHPRTRP